METDFLNLKNGLGIALGGNGQIPNETLLDQMTDIVDKKMGFSR